MQFPNDAVLKKEWKALPAHPSPRCGGARKFFKSAINNNGKNRYPDVLPFERTLVRLKTSPHCQYINANYIQTVPQETPRYIACQAPLPHTFIEFWIMVWENDTPVIVMLTRLMEKRKVKAHCYWPGEEGDVEIFGDIHVKLKEVMNQGNLVYRLFDISRGEETREILHIHYKEWPDFGAPDSTSLIRSVMSTMSNYRAAYKASKGMTSDPTVTVHCSAGIGRAGTFIAINAFSERKAAGMVDSNGLISVKDIVQDLRQQRMGMVQTIEQYCFIYRTILEMETGCPVGEPKPRRSASFVRTARCTVRSNGLSGVTSVTLTLNRGVDHDFGRRRMLTVSVPELHLGYEDDVNDEEDTDSEESGDYMDDDEEVGVIQPGFASLESLDHSQILRNMSFPNLGLSPFSSSGVSPLPTAV